MNIINNILGNKNEFNFGIKRPKKDFFSKNDFTAISPQGANTPRQELPKVNPYRESLPIIGTKQNVLYPTTSTKSNTVEQVERPRGFSNVKNTYNALFNPFYKQFPGQDKQKVQVNAITGNVVANSSRVQQQRNIPSVIRVNSATNMLPVVSPSGGSYEKQLKDSSNLEVRKMNFVAPTSSSQSYFTKPLTYYNPKTNTIRQETGVTSNSVRIDFFKKI
jgi:hypothetical protein